MAGCSGGSWALPWRLGEGSGGLGVPLASRGGRGTLPWGSPGELPQARRMTTGAKASLPSTQCLRMLSRMLGGKWMCRSHRKTMLLASWGRGRSERALSSERRVPAPAPPSGFPCRPIPPGYLHGVHASLQPCRALEVSGSPQVLVPGGRGQVPTPGGGKTHLPGRESRLDPTAGAGYGTRTGAAATLAGPAPRPCPRSRSPPG